MPELIDHYILNVTGCYDQYQLGSPVEYMRQQLMFPLLEDLLLLDNDKKYWVADGSLLQPLSSLGKVKVRILRRKYGAPVYVALDIMRTREIPNVAKEWMLARTVDINDTAYSDGKNVGTKCSKHITIINNAEERIEIILERGVIKEANVLP